MIKKKPFRFCQNKVVDLSNSPEHMCNVIECGRDKFTLSTFKLQDGHDDSLPYSAILCINGTPLCKCLNDGWGGTTEMTPLGADKAIKMKSLDLHLSKFKWAFKGTEFQLKLDFIADTLAITEANYLQGNIK